MLKRARTQCHDRVTGGRGVDDPPLPNQLFTSFNYHPQMGYALRRQGDTTEHISNGGRISTRLLARNTRAAKYQQFRYSESSDPRLRLAFEF
jgi:hypothetical protein